MPPATASPMRPSSAITSAMAYSARNGRAIAFISFITNSYPYARSRPYAWPPLISFSTAEVPHRYPPQKASPTSPMSDPRIGSPM